MVREVKTQQAGGLADLYDFLRWLTQRGIVAIPKSSHKERMVQNIDIFDFTLTDDDMAQIAKMNQHPTICEVFDRELRIKSFVKVNG